LQKTFFTGHETDRFLNNHCQECVRAYLSIHDCLSFLHEVMWVKKMFPWKFNLEYGGIFTKPFMHVSCRNMFPTTRNLQICVHVNHSRQNFQGNIFFTQNWCNITLSVLVKQFKHKNGQFFRLITERLVTLTTINYILIWFLVFNATFCFSNISAILSNLWRYRAETVFGSLISGDREQKMSSEV
jgi:hypothetical protein